MDDYEIIEDYNYDYGIDDDIEYETLVEDQEVNLYYETPEEPIYEEMITDYSDISVPDINYDIYNDIQNELVSNQLVEIPEDTVNLTVPDTVTPIPVEMQEKDYDDILNKLTDINNNIEKAFVAEGQTDQAEADPEEVTLSDILNSINDLNENVLLINNNIVRISRNQTTFYITLIALILILVGIGAGFAVFNKFYG